MLLNIHPPCSACSATHIEDVACGGQVLRLGVPGVFVCAGRGHALLR
jgi:hypothetical protein